MEGGSRSPCPLDMDFSTQIAALLSPPSAESVKDYYAELIAIRKCPGLKINFNNDSGKDLVLEKQRDDSIRERRPNLVWCPVAKATLTTPNGEVERYNNPWLLSGDWTAAVQQLLLMSRGWEAGGKVEETGSKRTTTQSCCPARRYSSFLAAVWRQEDRLEACCAGAVFSVKEFEEGELVLKDPVLVAAQHTTNKVDCLVCSHCFRFIGSVELQIGRKLILQDLGLTDDNEKDCTMASHNVGTDSLFDRKDDTSTSTYQNLKKNYISGEVLESLVGGKLSLPFSSIFSLPSVFDCPGGCKEEHYCSKSCADSDWEFVHSILCTGRNKESSQRDAMLKFIEHANIGRRSPGPHDTLEPVTGLGHPIQTHRRLKRRVQTRCGGEMTAVAVPSAVVAEGDELPPKAPPLHEAVWLMITSCLGGA
ncbi:hypothetical protein ZIOFF_073347 [Zingiber officinale]|uniref:MYND-type domain-containing protein n=1 Tax=Zingiber officinale TaxID=94328 RepID=A0A8J5EMC6_ZINOF|nr:hypothetical protein ZIOFF_073347 [Zingiber officinale]